MAQTIKYCRASKEAELNEILALQRLNLPNAISASESKEEGFVTVVHDFDILHKMNDKCTHIIAKSSDKVIGFALCMHPSFKDDITVLKPMFDQLQICLSTEQKFMVMGQICIAKPYRKKGIFKGLYNFMASELKNECDLIVTAVAATNTRSVNAHYAVGFKHLKTSNTDGHQWDLIALDLLI